MLYTILDIMSKTGSAVFDNLALLFAMGVAIGMAKKEKEVAALSGAIAYIVMNTTISALITAKGGVEAMAENSTTSVLGITTLQMGVFGGILVGLGVAALHNKFYKTELPQVLSFFGGTRFVPIVSTVTYLIVGIIMFYLWPIVQLGISKLAFSFSTQAMQAHGYTEYLNVLLSHSDFITFSICLSGRQSLAAR